MKRFAIAMFIFISAPAFAQTECRYEGFKDQSNEFIFDFLRQKYQAKTGLDIANGKTNISVVENLSWGTDSKWVSLNIETLLGRTTLKSLSKGTIAEPVDMDPEYPGRLLPATGLYVLFLKKIERDTIENPIAEVCKAYIFSMSAINKNQNKEIFNESSYSGIFEKEIFRNPLQ